MMHYRKLLLIKEVFYKKLMTLKNKSKILRRKKKKRI